MVLPPVAMEIQPKQHSLRPAWLGIWINTKRWLRDRSGRRLFQMWGESREGEWIANNTYEWLSSSACRLTRSASSFRYMMDGWRDKGSSLSIAESCSEQMITTWDLCIFGFNLFLRLLLLLSISYWIFLLGFKFNVFCQKEVLISPFPGMK